VASIDIVRQGPLVDAVHSAGRTGWLGPATATAASREVIAGRWGQVRNGPVTQYVMPPDDEPLVPRCEEK
jgi:hypothetical protein